MVCLFFSLDESQPCRAIEPILIEECNKKNIQLLKILTDNTIFFKLLDKFNVGILPRYVFIKEYKILYSSYGFVPRNYIKNIIKKIGEN